MTAIEAMTKEMKRLQQAQAECIDDWGNVKSSCKYKYALLIEPIGNLRESIQWMQQFIYPEQYKGE